MMKRRLMATSSLKVIGEQWLRHAYETRARMMARQDSELDLEREGDAMIKRRDANDIEFDIGDAS
ncbi:hypothetical protein QH494_02615 [Sphingomonas sp. AR_OL41]|uniref:hypothetical protein n=1 Tax=Sphingomonas sp. AR_OL41 TaxID=3042729 RepID=UPI002480A11D|nr:hypothetical protein [Sphingomonas sp. AR_OL41]MDH7971062.1 hypothetical protein [Sphingomonas sp. AR_OL41]